MQRLGVPLGRQSMLTFIRAMASRPLYGGYLCNRYALLTTASLWRVIGDAACNIQPGALRSIRGNAAHTCIAKCEDPRLDQRQHANRGHGSWSGAAGFLEFQTVS
jgi:hypothetical protein